MESECTEDEINHINGDFSEELGGYEDEDELSDGSLDELEQISPELVEARFQHLKDLDFPETVKTLSTKDGSLVFLVGTAHFSEESQNDVAMVIQQVKPDAVLLELCNNRVSILLMDEERLLEEAKNINLDKIKAAIKQSGFVQGLLHMLLLNMSAHLTKELGMAPGGEFRRAFKEAKAIQGCQVHLGDRPIQVTLQRALGSLGIYQKLRLAWCMLTSKDAISKEDVERFKDKDLLAETLKEMTGEFPALTQVFVDERDVYLAQSIEDSAKPFHCKHSKYNIVPKVVVAVVGIGHMSGIESNWEKEHDIARIMTVPPVSKLWIAFRWLFRLSIFAIFSWGGYRLTQWTKHALF